MDGDAAPLSPAEFATCLAFFVPFEPSPHLAIAVSGGADSMALVLLAARWARACGGRVTALTVDHRLRPAAATEAAQVARWLGARGIAHATLVNEAPTPRRDVQAQARSARYRLLEGWCADAGILHLLMAHHREDQAETVLLRLARGSGLDGLAAMAAVVERRDCRVLRPFLTVPRARLVATLVQADQEWIEDPSNRNPAFARVRLRTAADVLAAAGLTAERLAHTAAHLGRARAALETAVAALLAQAVQLDATGFAWLQPALLKAVPEEIGLRALAALLATIAGAEYPPRLRSLERLYRELPEGLAGGRTLGGCRLLRRRSGVLVCREPAAAAASVALLPGVAAAWDGRFRLRLPRDAPSGLSLGALGRERPARLPDEDRLPPRAVWPTLPTLRDSIGILAVPHLGYARSGGDYGWAPGVPLFRPIRSLGRAGFTVV
jgi:tRNA(Ile)-lysidine synthase